MLQKLLLLLLPDDKDANFSSDHKKKAFSPLSNIQFPFILTLLDIKSQWYLFLHVSKELDLA